MRLVRRYPVIGSMVSTFRTANANNELAATARGPCLLLSYRP
jgi:hypothetical protein